MSRKTMMIGMATLLALVALALPLYAAAGSSGPSFGPWGHAQNLESVPGTSTEINTAAVDGCPMFARDGRQLYFASNRSGAGGLDIWVADRLGFGLAFGNPVNVGAPINSASNDLCPSPLRDGQGFLFVSNRPGGCGGNDIYLTRWNPELGWELPVNLGCHVNSAADEAGPVLSFAEPGPPTLYFSSSRTGNSDLYQSAMTGDWSFGHPNPVPGVNSSYNDARPAVRHDGRELVFDSDRPGGQGGFDLWAATRPSIASPWSTPANLGAHVNSVATEARPSLSWDGRALLFGSNRAGTEGLTDLYYSTRD